MSVIGFSVAQRLLGGRSLIQPMVRCGRFYRPHILCIRQWRRSDCVRSGSSNPSITCMMTIESEWIISVVLFIQSISFRGNELSNATIGQSDHVGSDEYSARNYSHHCIAAARAQLTMTVTMTKKTRRKDLPSSCILYSSFHGQQPIRADNKSSETLTFASLAYLLSR